MQKIVVSEATKSAPPVIVTAAVAEGFTVNEWLAVATIIYIVMQACYLGWKWYKEWRKP